MIKSTDSTLTFRIKSSESPNRTSPRLVLWKADIKQFAYRLFYHFLGRLAWIVPFANQLTQSPSSRRGMGQSPQKAPPEEDARENV